MATSKAPKHDFAPAWLKIPEVKSLKPAGSKSSEQKDKSSYRRRDFPFDYSYGAHMISKQRSFDHYFDDRGFHTQKYRNHSSLDEDYYDGTPYAGYSGNYNGYANGSFKQGPNKYRENTYIPAGINRSGHQINHAYGGYADPYGYDFYPDRFTHPGKSNGGSSNRHRFHKEIDDYGKKKDNSLSSKTKNTADLDSGEQGDNVAEDEKQTLEEEFPSLNGESDSKYEEGSDKVKTSTTVWDKKPREKILQQHKESENNPDQANKDIKYSHSYIYKALLPNKNKNSKRNGDVSRSSALIKDINTSPLSKHNKENSLEFSPSAPIDILNTRMVTTPKHLSDKKSDFLKALKQEDDLSLESIDYNDNEETKASAQNCKSYNKAEKSEVIAVEHNATSFLNGFEEVDEFDEVDCLKGGSAGHLSSSMEAERRLLREMGWTEDDNDSQPITEEEIREIQQQLKQLQAREPRKNGLKRSLPTTWSPQHVPFCPPASLSQPLSNSTLSSDSDLE